MPPPGEQGLKNTLRRIGRIQATATDRSTISVGGSIVGNQSPPPPPPADRTERLILLLIATTLIIIALRR